MHLIGGYPGAIVGFALLVAVSATIYLRSRRVKVDHHNVNAEWKGDLTSGLQAADQPPPGDDGPTLGGVSARYDSDDPSLKANAS